MWSHESAAALPEQGLENLLVGAALVDLECNFGREKGTFYSFQNRQPKG
jgi:hypothetical protein